jgi:hypothetical protein
MSTRQSWVELYGKLLRSRNFLGNKADVDMAKGAKKTTSNRTYWCNIRLNEDEYNSLKDKLKTTYCRKVSDYVRNVLFEKPVMVRQRNQSMDDFMKELIHLRTDLNALGNNFNQVVKKLNSLPPSAEYTHWLSVAKHQQQQLQEKVDRIQLRINDFSDKWLQKLPVGKVSGAR